MGHILYTLFSDRRSDLASAASSISCQLYQRDLVAPVLEAIGVGMLPESAFTTAPFATDWLDTAESQRVLDFQRRTIDDYVSAWRHQRYLASK